MPRLSKADKKAEVSATEARRRKEVALAQLREMEVAEKAGKLYQAAAVKSAVVAMNAAIREAVLRIPDKLAPTVAATSDPREARKLLMAECKAILRNLSDEIRTH
jgi:CRISPR/Cas system-associated endonuclease Cas3-HD